MSQAAANCYPEHVRRNKEATFNESAFAEAIGNMPTSIQNRDGSLTKEPGHRTNKRQGYYAAVPAHLLDRENSVIDELIGFAFDTLGACYLDMRVYDEAATKALVEGEC
jgi:hypothetical protein